MKNARSVRLEFQSGVSSQVRARMSYAFRVFAAVYGYAVTDRDNKDETICCFYGTELKAGRSHAFHIPARYGLRQPEHVPPSPVRCSYAGKEVPLFHGRDEKSGKPDWLGEIFEWLSCADEMSITARDHVGRINHNQSVCSRYSVSPLKPYASLLM